MNKFLVVALLLAGCEADPYKYTTGQAVVLNQPVAAGPLKGCQVHKLGVSTGLDQGLLAFIYVVRCPGDASTTAMWTWREGKSDKYGYVTSVQP
jgi:hypothetical protein